MEALTLDERRALGDRYQEHWYRLVATMVTGQTVLDVGSGSGYGLSILLQGGASAVEGIDLLPTGPQVLRRDISEYPDASWDWVLAIDVIEHVEDDGAFLAHLVRVARRWVFLSTPNWNEFHAGNPLHVREYTPTELMELLRPYKTTHWASGHDLKVVLRGDAPLEGDVNFGVEVEVAR